MNQNVSAGEGERRVVEVEARTVDEAVARGLVRLGGLSRNEVEIEVLSGGRTGLLGFGSAPVRVRITELGPGGADEKKAKPASGRERAGASARTSTDEPTAVAEPEALSDERGIPETPEGVPDEGDSVLAPAARALGPEDRAEVEAAAKEIVGEMLRLLGYEQVSFDVRDSLLPETLEDERSLVLSIRGAGTERLLADGARPLNALQFLARLILSRRVGRWANLLLDVGGDRSRRMRELCQLAEQSALLVEREGRPVSLPPMTAYERRVVHLALRDHETIATQSIGSGDNRKVTVRRKDQLLPEA